MMAQKEGTAHSNLSIQVNSVLILICSFDSSLIAKRQNNVYFMIYTFSEFLDRPPLVIIFEDFEGFPPAVVQNFVTICR